MININDETNEKEKTFKFSLTHIEHMVCWILEIPIYEHEDKWIGRVKCYFDQ